MSAVFMRAVSLVSALPWLPSIPTRHLHSGLGSEYLESIYRHHSTTHYGPPSMSPLHVTFSPDSHNTVLWLTNNTAVAAAVVSCCCCITAVVRVLTRCAVFPTAAVSRLSSHRPRTTLHSPAQAVYRQHLVMGPYHNINTGALISNISGIT